MKPWKPKIIRYFFVRTGTWGWVVHDVPPMAAWTGKVEYEHRELYNRAYRYCSELNRKIT